MQSTIEKLRQRPDHHKKIVALGVAVVVTSLIFSVWLTSKNFFNSDTTVIAQAKQETPFSVMGDNIASAVNAFKDIFK